MRFDVITIGSATRDVFALVQDFVVRREKKFRAGRAVCFPLEAKLDLVGLEFLVGGGAVNTAITFARQGLKTAPLAMLGRDPRGDEVVKELKLQGVRTDLLQRHSTLQTRYAIVLSAGAEGRTIFRYPGAAEELKRAALPRTSWVYINHMVGKADRLLPSLVSQAKAQGIKIAWNPGTTQFKNAPRLRRMLGDIDVLLLNQEEASLVTGIPYAKRDQIFARLDEWVGGIVVMTRGPKGVEVSDGTMRWSAGILPLKNIVDRTGAGDAFGSGFVASLIRHPGDIETAVQFASANATGVLTQWGANKGLLKKGESPAKYGRLKVTRKKV